MRYINLGIASEQQDCRRTAPTVTFKGDILFPQCDEGVYGYSDYKHCPIIVRVPCYRDYYNWLDVNVIEG